MTTTSARIVITGAAGFLGTALAKELLAAESLAIDGEKHTLDSLVLVDLFPPLADIVKDPRVEVVTGDLDAAAAALGEADVIFHLAGVVSSAAESDFDLGMSTNLDALRNLLEAGRAMANPPVVVFTSSLAVYGADPHLGPVGVVGDDTLPRPQSSYGVQKFVGEQLVADYTRKGFVRGRSVRLMTVTVRPGKPNAAASSFISGMIREPLNGESSTCPVPPDLPIAVSSPRKTLEGILTAAAKPSKEWGSTTAMNLPSLTTTPRAMVDALTRLAGPEAGALVRWDEDPAIMAIVGSWPSAFETRRARSLGLEPEKSFDDIVYEYMVTLRTNAVAAKS
jgi:nucleoside-diphosphate-sugar epimerase